MYLDHFGLHDAPFGLTPDTAFVYESRSHREALDTLLVAIAGGEGFVKIVGEIGTGKSMTCRRFITSLDARRYRCLYLPNPCHTPRDLLIALCDEIQVETRANMSDAQLGRALNRAMFDHAMDDQRTIVCLDEAQSMPDQTLEYLRLLSNIETEQRKLLTVVLFGQPELDAKLAQHHMRQLAQRISFQYQLRPMNREETAAYVAHRLRVAGLRGAPLLDHPEIAVLHAASGGVPRLVNLLTHKALLLAFGRGESRIRIRHVKEAVLDTPAARRVGVLRGAVVQTRNWLSGQAWAPLWLQS